METVESPPYLDKCKSDSSKRGTHLDIYCNKIDVDRDRIIQKFDIYYLYYGFEYE